MAALMELGYHAERALPYCDGESPIDVLVEALSMEADDEEDAASASASALAIAAEAAPGASPGALAAGASGMTPIKRKEARSRFFGAFRTT